MLYESQSGGSIMEANSPVVEVQNVTAAGRELAANLQHFLELAEPVAAKFRIRHAPELREWTYTLELFWSRSHQLWSLAEQLEQLDPYGPPTRDSARFLRER